MTMGTANNADFAVGLISYNGDYYGRAYSDADRINYHRSITIALPAGFTTPSDPLFMLSLRIMNSIVNESRISYAFDFSNYIWGIQINQTSLTYCYISTYYYFIQQLSHNYLLISSKYRNDYLFLRHDVYYIGYNLTSPIIKSVGIIPSTFNANGGAVGYVSITGYRAYYYDNRKLFNVQV